jgi:DNA-binding transcriptional LysR family regulator
MAQADFTLRIAFEIDEPAALFGFVKAGLGVAFSPAFMKKQISEQGLTWLRLTHPTCHCTFGIAWHQQHYLSRAALAFRRFVIEYYSARLVQDNLGLP